MADCQQCVITRRSALNTSLFKTTMDEHASKDEWLLLDLIKITRQVSLDHIFLGGKKKIWALVFK